MKIESVIKSYGSCSANHVIAYIVACDFFKNQIMFNLKPIFSCLFCVISFVDPVDAFKLKIPAFLLFMFPYIIGYKMDKRNIPIIIFMILLNIISYSIAFSTGIYLDTSLAIHFFTFFILLGCVLWAYRIDLLRPIFYGSIALSILTIMGYFVIQFNPELELVLYEYSLDHDIVFLMSHRTFLGFDFVQFCFKSLPILTIPASLSFSSLITNKTGRLKNFLLSSLFFFAMFCAGNRAMLFGVLIIVLFVTYPVLKRKAFFKPMLYSIIVIAVVIIILALTEKGEESNEVKYGHLISYMSLFPDMWPYMLFGTGPGSFFYSIGFGGNTKLSEWTYIELYRMYGMIGGTTILFFLLKPLLKWKKKEVALIEWRPIALGYILFLIICGSNPYLINSTGLICILFMYSYVTNTKFRIEKKTQ